MDKELEEAQKLTKDDLVQKLEAGRPAKLRRTAPEGSNQPAKAIMDVVTSKTEREVPAIALGPRPRVVDYRPISELTSREELQSGTALRTVRQ
jgi:hypothetical protein